MESPKTQNFLNQTESKISLAVKPTTRFPRFSSTKIKKKLLYFINGSTSYLKSSPKRFNKQCKEKSQDFRAMLFRFSQTLHMDCLLKIRRNIVTG